MLENNPFIAKYVIPILFFPYFFQGDMLNFAWGSGDPYWLMILKRIFILLPVGAIIVSLWASIFSFITSIFRQNRQKFLISILMTWWDLGSSIFVFWGGIYKFLLIFIVVMFELLKILFIGIWLMIQDILLIPFRFIKSFLGGFLKPGVPWIAIALTFVWCIIEAIIFTYVMTPLVFDTLSNITGEELSEAFIKIPLFLFMMFLILGSYAVLSTWTEAFKSKNISAIIKIGSIELVAMTVEVLFLYREFVDSLMPWFAQHASEDFSLGIFGTLSIGFFAWLGIRGMTWFLFAAHGTPTIMAVIQGVGIQNKSNNLVKASVYETYLAEFVKQIKKEINWIQLKGEEFLMAFLLPPLQLVAATINFFTIFISSEHIFTLPLKSIKELKPSNEIIKKIDKK